MNPVAKIDYSDPWADRLEKCYTGIAEVTERVEQVLQAGNKVRTAILEGVDPVDACL